MVSMQTEEITVEITPEKIDMILDDTQKGRGLRMWSWRCRPDIHGSRMRSVLWALGRDGASQYEKYSDQMEIDTDRRETKITMTVYIWGWRNG